MAGQAASSAHTLHFLQALVILGDYGAMKPRWRDLYEKLYVRRSGIVGQGLYTPVAIAKGAKVGEFEGEVIGLREARRRAAGRRIVAIVELERHAIDATRTGRGFRFINHSCDANTFIRCTATRAEFYARRPIAPDEELTADYGESQHNGTLPCRCGAKRCRGYL
jgi:SET domain-containing protein